MQYCPKCGAENKATNEFCGKCGAYLEGPQLVQATPATSKKKRLTKLTIVIVLLVVIAGVSFWMYQRSNDNKLASGWESSQSSHQNANQASSATNSKNFDAQSDGAYILYYGAKKLNNDLYSGNWQSAKSNQQVIVTKETHYDVKGNGTYYSITPGETDSSIGFSISNGTVYLYQQGSYQGSVKQIGSAKLAKIRSYGQKSGDNDEILTLAKAAQDYKNSRSSSSASSSSSSSVNDESSEVDDNATSTGKTISSEQDAINAVAVAMHTLPDVWQAKKEGDQYLVTRPDITDEYAYVSADGVITWGD